MKRAIIGFTTFLASVNLASATLLLDDPFSYADGPLVTATSSAWTHHSGSVTGEVLVASGRALLSEAKTEDVHALLAGQPYAATGTTNVFYASFTVKFTTLPSGGGAYFAHFKDGSTGFRARVWALYGGTEPDRVRLGISSTSSSVISATNAAELNLHTDYTVVTRLVNTNSVATLWVNPTSESDAAVSTDEGASTFTVTGYALRENAGEGALTVDNLRVGTSFIEVAPGGSAQPPVITSLPHHQTVTNGADVRFSVCADGTPPLAYQWQFTPSADAGSAGTNLPGATSSNLTLTGATFARAGLYAVVVTNAAGSALRDPAALSVWSAAAPAFSVLTYNVHGNGLTNWSTNRWHVQAIGRQIQYLNPDIIMLQEIPVTNNCTAQMADFVTAFCPGYWLVTNSADDGSIRSVILSRFPIVASRSWLHGAELAPYGYTNTDPAPYFTRDLFEAEISVPDFPQPLHVFTTHLKSAQDADSAAKRSAEAGAISNFFATIYLPAHGEQPYLLSGDMNEDIVRPPASNPRTLQRLLGVATGLRLATPVNPFTDSELTWSIQDPDGLARRYDYLMPGAMLSSNIVRSQVFRTDLLAPVPAGLYSNDNKIASDHLPVLMVFGNPFNPPFYLLSLAVSNRMVSLSWESASNRLYDLDTSTNLRDWQPFATGVRATGSDCAFTTNVSGSVRFFRIRAP